MNKELLNRARRISSTIDYKLDVNIKKVLSVISQMNIGYQSDFSSYIGHYILKAHQQNIAFNKYAERSVSIYTPLRKELEAEHMAISQNIQDDIKAGINNKDTSNLRDEFQDLYEQLDAEVILNWSEDLWNLDIDNSYLQNAKDFIVLERQKQAFVSRFDEIFNDKTRYFTINIATKKAIHPRTVFSFLNDNLDTIVNIKRVANLLALIVPNDSRISNVESQLTDMESSWVTLIEKTSQLLIKDGDYDELLSTITSRADRPPKNIDVIVTAIHDALNLSDAQYINTVFDGCDFQTNILEKINFQGYFEQYKAISFTTIFEVEDKLHFYKGWYEEKLDSSNSKAIISSEAQLLKPLSKNEKGNRQKAQKQNKIIGKAAKKEKFEKDRDTQVAEAQAAAKAIADKAIADAKKMMAEMQKKHGR